MHLSMIAKDGAVAKTCTNARLVGRNTRERSATSSTSGRTRVRSRSPVPYVSLLATARATSRRTSNEPTKRASRR